MKMTKSLIIILMVLLGLTQEVLSQVGTISNWSMDRRAAVVLTFDDWSPGHYPIVVPELKQRNLNATFFIIQNNVSSWPNVVTTATNGNEIGNHTLDHPDLTTKTAAQLTQEIRDVKTNFDSHITSQQVISFAYPFGTGAGNAPATGTAHPCSEAQVRDSVKASGHIGARSVNPSSGNYTYNFATTNDDYYKILTYAMSGTVSTNAFFAEIQYVKASGGLLTFLYHSVDDAAGTYGDNWYNKVIKDSLEKQLDKLVSVQRDVWITTFGQAVKYHRERKCATLSEIQPQNTTSWVVNLTDTLSNNALYNQPLTLKLKLNGYNYNVATQNGNSLKVDWIRNDSIVLNALPDAGHITLTYDANVTITEVNNMISLSAEDIHISPVPSSGIINVNTGKSFQHASVVVYDALGKEAYNNSNVEFNNFSVDLSGHMKGIYYMKIYQNESYVLKKIILN